MLRRRQRFRALVLAAGFGTRLAPLTDQLPKPLVPVRGTTPLELALDRLAAAGCEAAAINLHHKGDAIREYLDRVRGSAAGGPGGRRTGPRWGEMEIVFSEEPEILGTLGALGPLRDFFSGTDAAVLVNGDSICRWPIKALLRRHRRSGAAATLLFSRTADPERFGGGVAVERRRRVVGFGGDPAADPERGRRFVFAGLHVLDPGLLGRVGDGRSEIVPGLYRPLLEEGRELAALATRRAWHDLGTPRRLRDGVLAGRLGAGSRPWPLPAGGTWIAPGVRLERGARVRQAVLESGVTVASEARVRRSVVLPGARIGAGSRIDGCVVGFGASVPPGTRVARRLVCRRTADASLPPGASVVEDLVYAPLDRSPARRRARAPGEDEHENQHENQHEDGDGDRDGDRAAASTGR